MATYQVTRTNADENCRHRAESVEAAAELHARRHINRRCEVRRTTGTPSLSGFFQAYLPVSSDPFALSSYRGPFHVREA